MQRHNFYIAQQTTGFEALAEFLYNGKDKGFYQSFLNINKPVAHDDVVGVGQTLYLPSTQDHHAQHTHEIQAALQAIDNDTQKMSLREKVIKAKNHVPIALAASGQYVGLTTGLIDYRYDHIKNIMEGINADMGSAIRSGNHAQAFRVARAGKAQLEGEVDMFTRLAFTRTAHFNTGVADQLKLHLAAAHQGIVDPKITIKDWSIESFKGYHLNINAISKVAKGAGYVGLGLSALSDGMNIINGYQRFGWSEQFGHVIARNAGDFVGGWAGGFAGGRLAQLVADQAVKRVASGLCVSIAEEAGIDALAVVAAPEVLAVAGLVLVGVGIYYGAKLLSHKFSHWSDELFTVFSKECHHWF